MNTLLYFSPNIRLVIIIGIILLVILRFVLRDKRRKTYDDDFGRPGTLLSRYNKGFVIDGTRRLSRKDSYRNVMVQGGVGSGKSTCIAIPFLKAVDDATLIINDNSGELLQASYADLVAKGYAIRVIRFRDPRHSAGYNVLERANTVGQINKTAQVIVNTTMGQQSKDPFWNQSAIVLLSLMIRILKEQPKKYHNLYNLRYLLELFNSKTTVKQIDALFAQSDEATFSSYRAFIGYGEKIVQGVVATCLASLALLQDEDIARVTSVDTLGDFQGLRKNKQAIFLQNNVTDLEYLRFVVDLFMGQVFEYLLSNMPSQDDLDMFFVLDEFGSSMKIPNAASAFATLRKTRTGLIIINQSQNQLVHNYGGPDAETIISNCYTKLYLPGGLDLTTAKKLEQRSGKFEYVDNDGVRRVRELITASEVLQIPQETGLLDVGNLPLMKLSMTPYYKKFTLGGKRDIPPLELTGEVPETITRINPTALAAQKETEHADG